MSPPATTIRSLAPTVRSGYRRLWRARKSLFGADTAALIKSASIVRAEFDSKRDVTDVVEATGMVSAIDECVEMLREGIVQGELNDRGNYVVRIDPEKNAAAKKDDRLDVEPIDPETIGRDPAAKPEVVVTTSGKP